MFAYINYAYVEANIYDGN